jgi:hypothetical protein
MIVAGLLAVGVGVAVLAWKSMCWALSGRLGLGLVVIAPAALAAVAAALLLQGPEAALTVPAAATLLGFALAVASDGDDRDTDSNDEPPWWPSFEHGLREYERARPLARRR